jgi:hypothetical protein
MADRVIKYETERNVLGVQLTDEGVLLTVEHGGAVVGVDLTPQNVRALMDDLEEMQYELEAKAAKNL